MSKIKEVSHHKGDPMGYVTRIGGFTASVQVRWIGEFIRICRKYKQHPQKYLIQFRGNRHPSRIKKTDVIWPRFRLSADSIMIEVDKIRGSNQNPTWEECPSCFNAILWAEDENRNALSRTDSKTKICFPCSQLEYAYGIKKGDTMSFRGYDPESGEERR